MRFRAKIWETGNSRVLTVPTKLEFETGQEVWVTLEPINEASRMSDAPSDAEVWADLEADAERREAERLYQELWASEQDGPSRDFDDEGDLGVVSAVKGWTTAKAFHRSPRVGGSHQKPPTGSARSSSHPRGTFYSVDEVC